MAAGIAILICFGVGFLILLLLVISSDIVGNLPDQFSGPMREIAKELGGKNFPARDRQLIAFRNQNVSFRFSALHRNSKKKNLRLTAPWPDSKFRARLFPEILADDVKRFIGMQDIKVGSATFDQKFVIQSNGQDDLIHLLSPEARHLILEIRKEINLTISGGTFSIEWNDFIGSRYLVMRTIRHGIAVFHALHNANFESDGIELTFIESDNATCMVCGEVMHEMIVACSRCDTQHHRDCWEYMEMCSTYGCGSKRSRNS